MLGDRIRKLRKQKKMTLEVLAGDELTKGMLSLIENNKAKPSMESLEYIGNRLGVEVSELLKEISSKELREVLDEAEKIYNMDSEKSPNKFGQLISLIEPYNKSLPYGYESARLLDLYARSLYEEKMDGWQELTNKAAKLYDQMNLTSKRASIGIFRAQVKFKEHGYAQALEIFLSERTEIESIHAHIDPMTRVDLDYYEAIAYFALGDSNSAIRSMESAIHYSREHKIFYRIDDLYRLAIVEEFFSKNKEKQLYYLGKLKQYGEFTDDFDSIWFHDLFMIMSLISDDHEYHTALKMIDKYLEEHRNLDDKKYWFYLEKGKALYGLSRYKEALGYFEKIIIPDYLHHPIDLSIFYVKDSYISLCHVHLGNKEEALSFAKMAVENFAPLPQTPFKDFCDETYGKIISIAKFK